MKKITAIILTLALMLAPVLSASAYEFYTEFPSTSFEAVVTAEEGAEFIAEPRDSTDEEKFQEIILTPGEKVNITGEAKNPSLLTDNGFETEGILYAIAEFGTDKGYIAMDCLECTEESYPYTKGKKLPCTDEFHVLDPDGIVMYEGPCAVFDEVTVIPFGADITISYADKIQTYSYGYTEYNGKSGWIYAYPYSGDCALARPVNETSFYTGKATVTDEGEELVDIYSHDDDTYKVVSDVIPVGTELTFEYYSFFNSCTAIYTSYNGDYGWLFVDENYSEPADSSCMIYYRDVLFLSKRTEIYSEPGDPDNPTGDYIPSGTLLNCNGNYFVAMDDYDEDVSSGMRYWALVEYDGKEVWITTDGTTPVYNCHGSYSPSYASGDELTIYQRPSENSGTVGTISLDDDFTMFMYLEDSEGNYWDYVNYNGMCGWITDTDYTMYADSLSHSMRVDDKGMITVGVTEDFSSLKADESEESTEEEVTSEEETTEEAENTVSNHARKGTVFLIIVIALCILAVVAVIVVVVLVRKRDAKLDEGYHKTE